MRVLAGDIGGTTTRLALMEGPAVLHQRRYPSGEFQEFAHVLAAFLAEAPQPFPEAGCLAVAGVVHGNRVRATNLPWTLDGEEIRDAFRLRRLVLINDFQAAAWGVTRVGPEHLVSLGGGAPDPEGPRAILGAGTGMGQALVIPCSDGLKVLPSEGGHADFAPGNRMEIRLLEHLMEDFPHVSVERVLSGSGLVAIYRFLARDSGMPEDSEVARAMALEDPAAVVTRHALAGTAPLCVEALSMFCSAYGSEAGNLALKCLATGGVYIAGGIAPRILPVLTAGGFREAFEAKGRMAGVLREIPVHVVTHPEPGLLGAGFIALR